MMMPFNRRLHLFAILLFTLLALLIIVPDLPAAGRQRSGKTTNQEPLSPLDGISDPLWPEADNSFRPGSRGFSPTRAANDQIDLVGQLGGSSRAVTIRQNYAYIADGPRLVILNITDPASPTVAGKSPPLPDVIRGIALAGDLAYVAGGDGGLRILNIADPSTPVEIGNHYTPGIALDVEIVENLAYVANGSSVAVRSSIPGMSIIDVADPSAPAQVGFYDLQSVQIDMLVDVAVQDNFAYIAVGPFAFGTVGALHIVDVSDPAKPTLKGGGQTPGVASSVVVDGHHAFVTNVSAFLSPALPGLAIIDITDPEAATGVSFYQTAEDATDVALAGDFAYVASWEKGLTIVDIGDLSTPGPAGHLDTPGHARVLDVAENHVYLGDSEGGLRIINAADPAKPREVAVYDTPYTTAVAQVENYAYLADGRSGLRIVDMSDPANPTEIGAIDTPGFAQDVAVAGKYAYLADGENGLQIIDVADPAKPVKKGHYDTPGDAQGVAVSGAYAYIADGAQGLRIINIVAPTQPEEAGSFDTGTAAAVALSENHAYVAAERNGLRIVDVTDPTAPLEAGHLEANGSALDVALGGSYAYVAQDSGGLNIVDIADPARPDLAGRIGKLAHGVRSVAVFGNYLYYGDWNIGLMVFNVADPTMPMLLGHFSIVSEIQSIAAGEAYVLFTPVGGGLYIAQYTGPYTISGRVTLQDGAPLPGVRVSAGSRQALTGGDGQYKIVRLEAGGYDLQAKLDGYTFSPSSLNITVPPHGSSADFIATRKAGAWTVQLPLVTGSSARKPQPPTTTAPGV